MIGIQVRHAILVLWIISITALLSGCAMFPTFSEVTRGSSWDPAYRRDAPGSIKYNH